MATMLPHSYASDATATQRDAWQWLLFVQQKRVNAFTLTAVAYNSDNSSSEGGDVQVTRAVKSGKRALYELQLDKHGLHEHIEELGIEVDVNAFVELFRKTLENRACVDVVVNQKEDQAPGKVSLVLTYKFSETISRKGCFALPLVAADIPEQVVNLLSGLHATPNVPVLTESQKRQREAIAAANAATSSSTTNSTASVSSTAFSFTTTRSVLSQDQGEHSQNNSNPEATTNATRNPQVLKRRHVPSGTIRRKGPKGAKIAKK